MSDQQQTEDVFADHARRSARRMKMIVAMFALVLFAIFLIIVIG